jgi:hypothetical protein
MHNCHQNSARMKVRSRRGYEVEITICVLRHIWGFVTTYILNDVCGTQDRGQCRALVNMVMNFRAP